MNAVLHLALEGNMMSEFKEITLYLTDPDVTMPLGLPVKILSFENKVVVRLGTQGNYTKTDVVLRLEETKVLLRVYDEIGWVTTEAELFDLADLLPTENIEDDELDEDEVPF